MRSCSKRGEGLSHIYAWHKGLRDNNVINFSLPMLAQQLQHLYDPFDNYGVSYVLNKQSVLLKDT